MGICGFHFKYSSFILIGICLVILISTCDVLRVGLVNNNGIYTINMPEGRVNITTSIYGAYLVSLECDGTYEIKPSNIRCYSSNNRLNTIVIINKETIFDDLTISNEDILIEIIPLSRKKVHEIELDLKDFLLVNGESFIRKNLVLTY